MSYELFKSIVSDTWQVDGKTFAQYYPVRRKIMEEGLQNVFGVGAESEVCKPFDMSVFQGGDDKNDKNDKPKYVRVIPIRGVMLKHDAQCGPAGMRTVGRRLTEGDKRNDVIGSILLFESGGGQSSAVPELTDAIRACRKPTVAYIDEYACSAAIYAASYCREIVASRETDTVGSIGTLIAFDSFKKFVESDDGLTHVRVYADGADDKNGEFEAAVTGDFKLLKETVLNPVNERFKADMRANRKNVKEEHLTGKTYEAKDVLGVLVDSIGTLEYAVGRVAEIAEAENKIFNNTLNMSKLILLSTLLAVTELSSDNDGNASLNAEQLGKIEAELQTSKTRIAELEAELRKKPAAAPANADADTDGDKPVGEETFYGRLQRLSKESQSY